MDMVIAVAAVAAAVLSLAALLSSLRRDRTGDALKEDIIRANDRALASAAAASARQTDLIDQHMKERQDVLRDNVTVSMAQMEQRLRTMETMNEQKLEAIRVSMEQRL